MSEEESAEGSVGLLSAILQIATLKKRIVEEFDLSAIAELASLRMTDRPAVGLEACKAMLDCADRLGVELPQDAVDAAREALVKIQKGEDDQ